MSAAVQVRERGVVTLPADLRKKYSIQAGDTFQVVDLDGLFVFTPMVPLVPELAREIEKARIEAGLGTEQLLAGLREQRERYPGAGHGMMILAKVLESTCQVETERFSTNRDAGQA